MVRCSLGTCSSRRPFSARELARRTWDAVVVGGGHNGLTAAAYLARAGRSVLVLERRAQLGGACTLERPFSDPRAVVSPCAYVVGLLDGTVVAELELVRHGYRVTLADPNLWSPLPDGRTVAQYLDSGRTRSTCSRRGSRGATWTAWSRTRTSSTGCARRAGTRCVVGPSPSTATSSPSAWTHDPELLGVLFEDSIADVLERYVEDPDLPARCAVRASSGPWPGRAIPGRRRSTSCTPWGRSDGVGGAWGYVEGGMGRVSAALAAAPPVRAPCSPWTRAVAEILPGEGVVLASGERIAARAVLSNADPKRTCWLVGADVPAAFAIAGGGVADGLAGREGQRAAGPSCRRGPPRTRASGRSGR